MRSRLQLLGPIYLLTSEALKHLEDAMFRIPSPRDPLWGERIDVLIDEVTKRCRAVQEGGFLRAYHNNDPVNLNDLHLWLDQQEDGIATEDPGQEDDPEWVSGLSDALISAYQIYYSTNRLVQAMQDFYDDPEQAIVPPDPVVEEPASS